MAAWLLTYRSTMTDPPPVREDWAEREARGAAPDRGTYRCPDPGCPVTSAHLAVMVTHVKAHREADDEAAADPRAVALNAVPRALQPGRRWPDPQNRHWGPLPGQLARS